MTPILAENVHGHGALPLPLDLRDHKYNKLAMASLPFDWVTGYDTETSPTPTKNQGTSGSCGGQAGSYLDALINKTTEERSARYIYSQIFYPGGGTTLRDILQLLVKKGSASESSVPSYQDGQPPTETFIEDKSLNSSALASAAAYEASGYAFVAPDIESYAQAIRDNGGAIMQLNGQNNGSWLSLEPLGPSSRDGLWSHFLICTAAIMVNGKKCIKVHNSWGPRIGDNGYQYITEDYFKTGNILQGGVIYAKDSPVITAQKITLMKRILALLQQLINMKRNISGWVGGIMGGR